MSDHCMEKKKKKKKKKKEKKKLWPRPLYGDIYSITFPSVDILALQKTTLCMGKQKHIILYPTKKINPKIEKFKKRKKFQVRFFFFLTLKIILNKFFDI